MDLLMHFLLVLMILPSTLGAKVVVSNSWISLKAFVTENKFKRVLLVNLDDKDVSTATNDLLNEAKSNLLKWSFC